VCDTQNKNAYEYFKRDPFGCRGDLMKKKLKRDPLRTGHPFWSIKELEKLFQICESLDFESLEHQVFPWEV
jgi:hypothetical protein